VAAVIVTTASRKAARQQRAIDARLLIEVVILFLPDPG
jgi:hypothetical protein